MRLVSLERSKVVTWWQWATLVLARPADAAGMLTTVGPRLACEADVEIGTTMTDFQLGVRLKAL